MDTKRRTLLPPILKAVQVLFTVAYEPVGSLSRTFTWIRSACGNFSRNSTIELKLSRSINSRHLFSADRVFGCLWANSVSFSSFLICIDYVYEVSLDALLVPKALGSPLKFPVFPLQTIIPCWHLNSNVKLKEQASESRNLTTPSPFTE